MNDIFNLPFLIVGGWVVGQFLYRIVGRWLGRTGGDLHVDCPTCWRRLSAGYCPTTSGEQMQQGIRLGVTDPVVDYLRSGKTLEEGKLELTCRCGTKVIVLGLNPVEDVSEGSSHG